MKPKTRSDIDNDLYDAIMMMHALACELDIKDPARKALMILINKFLVDIMGVK